jgi:ATP-dependent Clp endopeptidase proteolytic subunit ClpP
MIYLTDPLIKEVTFKHEPIQLILKGIVDGDMLEKTREAIEKAHASGQRILPVYIDSYGGMVHTTFGIVSYLLASKLEIVTICTSKAMSAGAIILALGSRSHRYCSPYASIMLHEIGGAEHGKVTELKVEAAELDRLNSSLWSLMDSHCQKPLGYFVSLMKSVLNADLYLTPEQALTHNLIDHVSIPEFIVETTVSFRIN